MIKPGWHLLKPYMEWSTLYPDFQWNQLPDCSRFNKDEDEETNYTAENCKDWLEKIQYVPTEGLEPGDRIYFWTPGIKGKGRWKRRVIIGRKEPYVYSDGIRPANGFDIFNMESGMMVSRSRWDIRKFRKTKEETDLVREAIKIGNQMKKS